MAGAIKNIGELRAAIKDLPDNLPILLESENAYGNDNIINVVRDSRVERDGFHMEGVS
jgi:hypothetical protein